MRPSFGQRHQFGHRDPRDPRGHFAPDFAGFEPPDAAGGPPFPPFPPGPWPGGRPGEFPFGGFPDGRHGGRGHGRGRGRGGWGQRPGPRRSRRGDVRAAILALLAERPMHGYEMIQEITERSGQFWRPSPGSVYPTLQLLADEGLITDTEGSGGKRRYELTEEGRAAAEKLDSPPWEQIARDVDPHDVNLRGAIGQLMGATVQVAQAATDAQKVRAVEVLNEARRELYAILGEVEPPAVPDDEDDSDDDTD